MPWLPMFVPEHFLDEVSTIRAGRLPCPQASVTS